MASTDQFSVHDEVSGERLNSSLSRVSMVVWLFVVVMLTMNYTASLSSLLTVQRLEEAVTVGSLKGGGPAVGSTNGSVVAKYLQEVLLFPEHSIRRFSRDEDYRRALSSGEVKASFASRTPSSSLPSTATSS